MPIYKTTPVKNFALLLISCFFSFQIAQAQEILSIEVVPAEPTVTDTINIIITTVFPSGGCDGTIEYGLFENNFYASSLHCLGFLTVICIDIDTLIINPLPEGQYNFTYVLSAGYGPPGECTPGIVPDDNETISFYVSPPLNVTEFDVFKFSAFPNPAIDFCTLQFETLGSGQNTLNVYDAYGRSILTQPIFNTSTIQINTSALAKGLYFLQLEGEMNNRSRVLRLVKE
jgi:hypothetical protein